MSSVYSTEPPTEGLVLLKTSLGDLRIGLWPKQAPMACRNFVQLCLDGLYDDTTFHRVVKGLLVQGGDPTGTGTGGESAFGGYFRDEYHSRLSFSHRGIVACAKGGGEGASGSSASRQALNGSQFFITLAPAPALDRTCTIFGRLEGDSIFALLRCEDLEVGGAEGDEPVHPPRVLEAVVEWNPFEGEIAPRVDRDELRRTREEAERRRAAERRRQTLAVPSAGGGLALPAAARKGTVSFLQREDEEDDEEEEEELGGIGGADAAIGLRGRLGAAATATAAFRMRPSMDVEAIEAERGDAGEPRSARPQTLGAHATDDGIDRKRGTVRSAVDDRQAAEVPPSKVSPPTADPSDLPSIDAEVKGSRRDRSLSSDKDAEKSRNSGANAMPGAGGSAGEEKAPERERPRGGDDASRKATAESALGKRASDLRADEKIEGSPSTSTPRDAHSKARSERQGGSRSRSSSPAPVDPAARQAAATLAARRRELAGLRTTGRKREKDTLERLKAFEKKLRGGALGSSSQRAEPGSGKGHEDARGKGRRTIDEGDGAKAFSSRASSHPEASVRASSREDKEDADLLAPAAWRVNRYLDREDASDLAGGLLGAIRGHRLVAPVPSGRQATGDDADWLVVDERQERADRQTRATEGDRRAKAQGRRDDAGWRPHGGGEARPGRGGGRDDGGRRAGWERQRGNGGADRRQGRDGNGWTRNGNRGGTWGERQGDGKTGTRGGSERGDRASWDRQRR